MKAIYISRPGGPEVLELREVPVPVPGDDEVLVRVRASSVNAADWHLMRGKPYFMRLMGFGLRTPRFPARGADVAGVVVAFVGVVAGKVLSMAGYGSAVRDRGEAPSIR